ncbi:lipase maturation factor 2b [Chanos chanos]|uniref:Lipase maturation factor n=1 Tax=Chanos chanos TaxID=29144 RepID=A0A6J2V488_CHACN|nr:lipase maturation factor 2-like [Chanos chanos]
MGEITIPRQMFLWSVASIYMCAFASLYIQIPGLFGDNGVVPVRSIMPRMEKPLLEQLQEMPTLLWLAPYLGLELQQGLELICLVGALLSLSAVLLKTLRNSLVYLCLWALYLSLYQVSLLSLFSRWDRLLLETGFLAILVAPLLRSVSSPSHHDAMTFWLTRWLFFRLIFGSGVSKLSKGDTSWWELTALTHYFEDQASPTPLAWYAYQLPYWLLKLCTIAVLEAEIIIPLLMFFSPIRCLRLTGFYIQIFLQLCQMLLGNWSLLNLLTIALSFSLLDDEKVRSWPSPQKKKKTKTWSQTFVWLIALLIELAVGLLILYSAKWLFGLHINWEQKTVSSKTNFNEKDFEWFLRTITVPSIWIGVLSLTWEVVIALLGCFCERGFFSKLLALVQWAVFTVAVAGMFALSLVPYTATNSDTVSNILPELRKAHSMMERYQLVHAYDISQKRSEVDGRPDVILQGSKDGKSWMEIQFMYKPDSLSSAPPVLMLHQPRLDWHIWQLSSSSHNESPWFTSLILRLLQGKPEVVNLIQVDEGQYPFSKEPPAFIRAQLYNYHFTKSEGDGSQLQKWWKRQYVRDFYPTVNINDQAMKSMLSQLGPKGDVHIQPSIESLLSQALVLVRDHIKGLPGHLVLISLFATVACLCLLKLLLFRPSVSQKMEPRSKKPKDAAGTSQKSAASSSRGGRKENKEEKGQDSDRSPRKRK